MCSKCYVNKEAMAGRAIGQNIKGFTDTAKRDPHLLREVEPVPVGGWLVLVGMALIVCLVFAEPVLKAVLR